jgi:hypothetical protein
MIGRILKLAIAGLCLYAAWQICSVYWQHYQFDDKVQQIAQFEVDHDDENIRAQIVDEAQRLGLPVQAEQVIVRRQSEHLYIDISYTVSIQVLPRFRKPWSFAVSAHGWFVPGGRIPAKR